MIDMQKAYAMTKIASPCLTSQTPNPSSKPIMFDKFKKFGAAGKTNNVGTWGMDTTDRADGRSSVMVPI